MFDKQDTTEKLVSIIADILNVDKNTLKRDASFEELGADSLDRLEIIMKIEETFGVDISDEQEAHIKTITQAADAVHALRNK